MEELDRSYEVIDNFVQPKVFDIMQKKIMNNYFPWFHYDTIVREGEDKKDLTFYSMHMLYDNDRPTFSNSFEIMDPVLGELMKLDDPKFRMNTLIRVYAFDYISNSNLSLKTKAKTVKTYLEHYKNCEKKHQSTPSSFMLEWGD